MSDFVRPTLQELIDRISTDIETAVGGITARLRRTFEYGVARALAGVSHGLHGHLGWVAEQILPDQAAERFLLRWANLFGVDRNPAVRATGNLTVTGTGGDIAEGTQWVRLADDVLFEATAAVDDIDPSAAVPIRAVEGGDAGNMEEGQELVLVTPIAGIVSEAVVAAGGLTGGTDIETLDALLERLVDRIQRPPMGGAPTDHVTWAMEVAGTSRAWEFAGKDGDGNPGLGKVAVAFTVLDGEDEVLPTGDQRAAMLAYLTARSPFEVFIVEMTALPVDMYIYLDPNTEAVQEAVTAELADLFRRDSSPGGTMRLSRLSEAISAATDEEGHEIETPAADVVATWEQFPTLGDITFDTLE